MRKSELCRDVFHTGGIVTDEGEVKYNIKTLGGRKHLSVAC